ncbi:MAG: hypothetical protein ACK46X_01020 [Candidatus Sericytochromatia bacterium]
MATTKPHRPTLRRPAPTTPLSAPLRRVAVPSVAMPAPKARRKPAIRWRLDARRWEVAIVLVATALACVAVPALTQPALAPTELVPAGQPPVPVVRTW